MPDLKDIPELLQYLPWGGRGPGIPDPGPWVQWLAEEVGSEARTQLLVSEFEFQKEVIAARTKAIDRNIAILTAKSAKRR